MPPPPAVRLVHLHRTYGSDETAVRAVDDVTLEIEAHRMTAVVGPSGSGKSTLLHCAAGLDRVDAGQVFIGETEITALSDDELTRLRRTQVGFVFQAFNLMPALDANANIRLPLQLAGRRVDEDWLARVVRMLDIGGRLTHRPDQLSGGEQQRVAIARALVTRPRVIFADEPTGALDRATSRVVLDFLRRCVDHLGQTVVMVTHDPAAAAWADRVVEITDGRISDDRRAVWAVVRTVRVSRAAALAVLISTALVCLIGLVGSAVDAGLHSAVRTAIADAPVVLRPGPGRETLPEEAARVVAEDPRAPQVVPQLDATVLAPTLGGIAVHTQSLPHGGQLRLVRGRMPNAPGEAVLAEVAAKPVNVTVGTRIEVQGTGAPRPVTVVGLVTAPPGVLANRSIPTLLGTMPDVQAWSGRTGYSRLLVFSDEPAGQLAGRLARVPGLADEQVRAETGEAYVSAHVAEYAPGARTLILALRMMGLIALVVAVVVVANTFTIKLAQRSRELGLLRRLGATRAQVFRVTLTEGLLTGAAGALAGVLVGHLVAAALIGRLAFDLHLAFRFSLGVLVYSLLAGTAAALAAVVRPGWRATRVAPLAALHTAEPAPVTSPGRRRAALGTVLAVVGLGLVTTGGLTHSVLVAAAGGVIGVIGPVVAAPTLFPMLASALSRLGGHRAARAAAELRRHPGRSGATAIAIWFGATMITTVLVGAATASATLAHALDESTPTDVAVAPAGEPAGLARQLRTIPQVVGSAPVDSVMLDADKGADRQELTVVAWNPGLQDVLRSPGGAPEPAPGTVQVPRSFGVADGDPVTLTSRHGSVELVAVTLPDAPGVGVVGPTDFAVVAPRSQADVWVKLAPGADQRTALDAIQTLAGPDAQLSSPALQRAEIDATIAAATRVAAGLLGVTVVIALVGVSNTLSLSVIERTSQIGLLRALGALRGQIRADIAAEALLTVGPATLLGIVFGTVYGLGGVSAALAGEQLAVVGTVPWPALAAVLAGSVPCALLASVTPANRAAALPPIAALGVPGET